MASYQPPCNTSERGKKRVFTQSLASVFRTCGIKLALARPHKGKCPVPLYQCRAYPLHTESLLLPFARLRAKTFLPPDVFIRARNPCFLIPFILVGVLKHFFIMGVIVTQNRRLSIQKSIAKRDSSGIMNLRYVWQHNLRACA